MCVCVCVCTCRCAWICLLGGERKRDTHTLSQLASPSTSCLSPISQSTFTSLSTGRLRCLLLYATPPTCVRACPSFSPLLKDKSTHTYAYIHAYTHIELTLVTTEPARALVLLVILFIHDVNQKVIKCPSSLLLLTSPPSTQKKSHQCFALGVPPPPLHTRS